MQRKIFSRQRGPECKCTRKETWRSHLYNFYWCYRKVDCNCKLFHDGVPYHIDWTGFYVIRISVMKGEKDQHSRFFKSLWYAVWDTFSIFKCAKRNLYLSGTTVRRSAVEREGLKWYWKSKERPHFPRLLASPLFTNFSKA